MYRILLFSDSRYRDSFGSALLKYELDQLGFYTEVASFNYWDAAIKQFNPHIVVLNHIQGVRNNRIASRVKRNGGLVFVLFNEGVIEFDNKRTIFEQQKDHELVDLFLCWNSDVADLLGEKVAVVGHPRFDIYGRYQNVMDSPELFRQKWDIPDNLPIALFGSSFPSAKFTYMLQDFHRGNWSDLGNTGAQEWSDADEFAKTQADYLRQFMSIVINVASNLNVYPVVKPHPMSDIDMWKKFGKEWDVHIVDEEYIFNALNACQVYVAKLGSISAAESLMLAKPTITFSFGYDSAASGEQKEITMYRDKLLDNYLETIGEATQGLTTYSESPIEYLEKWGILFPDSSRATSEAMVKVINDNPPVLIKDRLDSYGYRHTTSQHDTDNSGYRVDPYGNHNKAVRRYDINYWYKKIEQANN